MAEQDRNLVRQNVLGTIRNSNFDEPVFVKARAVIGYSENVWEGRAYVRSAPDSDFYFDNDQYLSLCVLDGKTEKNDESNVDIGMGSYFNCRLDNIQSFEKLDTTPELLNLKDEFNRIHEESPYKVIGRLFESDSFEESLNENTFFKRYEEIANSEKEWDLKDAVLNDGSKINSLDKCRMWMLENHPDYYMGMNAMQQCKSGDFLCMAVPCGEYQKGYYETFANRLKYAQQEADRLGVELGKSEMVKERKSERKLPDIDIDYGDVSDVSLER